MPSTEDVLVEERDDRKFADEMERFIKTLTETQKRRLYLAVFRKMDAVEIANCEGVHFTSVYETLTNIEKKLKKFIKTPLINGKKMAVSERINSLRVLIEKHWKRLDTDTE